MSPLCLTLVRYLAINIQRTAQHAGRAIKEIAKLLLTIVTWPVLYTYTSARNILSPSVPQPTKPTKPSLIEILERDIKILRGEHNWEREKHHEFREQAQKLNIEVHTAKWEARKARRSIEHQDALVTDQQKTIKTLQQQIASFPQEYLQLREKSAQLAKDVDALEQKAEEALEARNGAEKQKDQATKEADAKVTEAEKLQQSAEDEKDRAESFFEEASNNFEDRLKISASQIFKLKQELAKRSRIDPRIFSQLAEQVHSLHRERDDARDALDLVNARLEATKAREAAAQSLVQTIRAELQSADSPDGIEAKLYNAEVELAQCKTDAQRMVKAAGSKTRHYKKESEADRNELLKAKRSFEEKEGQYRTEIFELTMKHDGKMRTAQSTIANLEAWNEDLRASNATLDANLERAETEAGLHDPELQANLTRATAELQGLRSEHASELERVRDEHASQLNALRNKHATALQRVRGDHAKELQKREAETLQKCQDAYRERSAEWSEGARKSDQQVDYWRSRAEAAEASVKTLNQTAERVAREQEQRERDFKPRLDELQSEAMRARDELGDLQARLSQGNQQIVAADPTASVQVLQFLPAPQSNQDMPQEEMDEWLEGLEPVTSESIMEYQPFDQPTAADSAVPPQTSTASQATPDEMSATIDDWLDRYPELNPAENDPLLQPLAAEAGAPLQTSPTSPPPEPPLEFPEPELNIATVPDPYSVPTSASAQEPEPSAAPQHSLAPTPAPHSGGIFTSPSLPRGMTPRGPRNAKSKPNHYTQERRKEEAAYDATIGPKLDWMFGHGPRPSAPPAPTQSVPLGIPGSSSFGKIASCIVLQALI